MSEVCMGARIRVSFTVVTPESAEHGNYAETGWDNEEGLSCEPDESDREEGWTRVDLARIFLERVGPLEASSSAFCPGMWFEQTEGAINYRTGAERRLAFHLDGFSVEEQRAIYEGVKS